MAFHDEDIDRVRGANHPAYQRIRDAARNPHALEDGSFGDHSRRGRAYGETESQARLTKEGKRRRASQRCSGIRRPAMIAGGRRSPFC